MLVDNEQDSNAWYREPWLWFVLAPLILVVFASIITVSIAFNTADDVVVDNYYREGRMLTQDFTADEYANTLGLNGKLSFQPGWVSFTLNNTAFSQDLILLISHPAKAALDRSIKLRRISAGYYKNAYDGDLVGRWYLRLSAYRDTNELWRMHGEIDLAQNTDTVLK